MKSAKLIGGAAVALGLALLAPGAAHAQTLLPTSILLPPLETQPDSGKPGQPGKKYEYKAKRFDVGLGVAFWNFPNDAFDQGFGPLITAEYHINKNWSLGGFYNHIDGDFNGVGGGKKHHSLDYSGDNWDIHAAYRIYSKNRYLQGLSAQVGYSELSTSVSDLPHGDFTANALNFWLNKNQHLTYLGKNHTYPVSIFAGIGYYVDTDNDAFEGGHVVAGASIGVYKNINLTGSWWGFGIFNRPDGLGEADRFSLGLSGSF